MVRHLLQRTTAHNRRQKTTLVSQFITQVLRKSSVNFNQGLRAMTRRFCAHWATSFSAVLQVSTTSKLYQISAVMVKTMHQNGLHDILPVLYKVASMLATIPATSCSAGRSFSALRRIKTFFKIHNGTRKTDLAVSPLLTLKESMQTRQCRMTYKGLLTYLGLEVIVLHTSFRAQMGTFYLSLHGFVF